MKLERPTLSSLELAFEKYPKRFRFTCCVQNVAYIKGWFITYGDERVTLVQWPEIVVLAGRKVSFDCKGPDDLMLTAESIVDNHPLFITFEREEL